jgi:N-acetylneuraminic acid mutarotase
MHISAMSAAALAGIAALFATAVACAQAPAQPPAGAHSLHSAPPPAPAGGPWVKLAPFPQPAEEVLGAVAGGKLYVFAGLAPGWKPIGLVFEYDPAADKWTQKKPMPVASHHVAFTSHNDKIYAFGGFRLPESGPPAWVPISEAWEYDPATDTWKALAPMPSRRGAAAAAVVNGKIHVIGGASVVPGSNEAGIHPARAHQVLGLNEEYDPATNSWRARAPMPTPRNHHVVAAANNKIYAIGGRIGSVYITGQSSNVGIVEEYDPVADAWGGLKLKMPTPRSATGSGVHNGRIIVAGGEYQDEKMLAAYKVVEAYEPSTNRWFTLPPMPFPRHGLAAGVVGNRFHTVSGDVQSARSGGHVHVEYHDALDLAALTR